MIKNESRNAIGVGLCAMTQTEMVGKSKKYLNS